MPPPTHMPQAGCAPPVGVVACLACVGVALTGHPRSLAYGFSPRTPIAPTGISSAGSACQCGDVLSARNKKSRPYIYCKASMARVDVGFLVF